MFVFSVGCAHCKYWQIYTVNFVIISSPYSVAALPCALAHINMRTDKKIRQKKSHNYVSDLRQKPFLPPSFISGFHFSLLRVSLIRNFFSAVVGVVLLLLLAYFIWRSFVCAFFPSFGSIFPFHFHMSMGLRRVPHISAQKKQKSIAVNVHGYILFIYIFFSCLSSVFSWTNTHAPHRYEYCTYTRAQPHKHSLTVTIIISMLNRCANF